MTIVAISSPLTDAVIEALKTLDNPAGGPILVGDGVAPVKTPPAKAYPYCVVFVGTTLLTGSLRDPKEDGLHRVQVTSVGRDRKGAEWLRDQVRALLCDPTSLDIIGGAVVSTELVNSLPISRDDDEQPPVFYAVDVVNVLVTPSEGS